MWPRCPTDVYQSLSVFFMPLTLSPYSTLGFNRERGKDSGSEAVCPWMGSFLFSAQNALEDCRQVVLSMGSFLLSQTGAAFQVQQGNVSIVTKSGSRCPWIIPHTEDLSLQRIYLWNWKEISVPESRAPAFFEYSFTPCSAVGSGLSSAMNAAGDVLQEVVKS